MKKTLVCLLLVALLALALAVPAMADEAAPVQLDAPVADYEVSDTVYLDLNGNSITGTLTVKEGGKLYLFDSKTSDYNVEDDDYGRVANIVVREGGEHVRDFVLPASFGLGRHRYVTIKETSGAYSAHRFYVGIGQFSLYPKYNGSLVLRSMYLGDSVLTNYVEEYGVLSDLGAKGTIAPDTVPDTKDVFAYTAGTTDAQTQNHLIVRIYDVLNAEHKDDWAEYTMDKYINAQSYIKLTDGTELTSSVVGMSFQEAVLAAQAQIDGMTAAQVKSNAANITALTNMYQKVITAEEGNLLTDWSTSTTRIPYYCLCGASVNGGEHALGCKEGCEEKPFLWKPWDGSDLKNTTVGTVAEYNYYLTADCSGADSYITYNYDSTVTSSASLGSIVARMDLNGHNLTSTSRVFQPWWNTTLWVSNSVPDEGGVVTGTAGKSHSNVIQMVKGSGNNAVSVMQGVTLTSTNAETTQGGIITVNGGTFDMYGGTLDASKLTVSGNGGAVYIDGSGTFTMHGGEITGGKAVLGGGIYSVGAFDMKGGEITNCSATNQGGAVYLSNVATATMKMSKGSINNNYADSQGGGVFVNGSATLKMTGGDIQENVVDNNGGGIYTNGAVTISGGNVINNVATDAQIANADINCVDNGTKALTINGGTVGKVTVNAYGVNASIYVSGAPVIRALNLSKNTGAFPYLKLEAGKTLKEGASIGVISNSALTKQNGVFTENDEFKDYAKYITNAYGYNAVELVTEGDYANELRVYDDNTYCICASTTGEHEDGCDGTEHTWNAWNLATQANLPNTDGYWYLTGTPKSEGYGAGIIGTWAGESATATDTHTVAIDLRGKQITMKSNSRILNFGQNAAVTLSVADSVGGAKITHSETTSADQGLAFWNRGTIEATLKIYGGTYDLRACTTPTTATNGGQGSIDMNEGDTVIIAGDAVIYGYNVDKAGKGGVICFRDSSNWAKTNTLKLSGNAKLYGSKVASYGGAVYSNQPLAFSMTDNAQIIGGEAGIRAGSVYMNGGGSFSMSGNAKILDGKVYNTNTSGTTAHGGSVFLNNASAVLSDNALISGGISETGIINSHGGNLYTNQNVTMSGNAKIIGGNAKNGQGGNIYFNGTLNMSDNAEISGGKLATNATASNADVFCVNGSVDMSGSAKIGYIAAYNTEAAGVNYVKLQGAPVITKLSFTGGAKSATTLTNPDIFTVVNVNGILDDAASICVDLANLHKGGVYEFSSETVAENANNFTSPQGTVLLIEETNKLAAHSEVYCLCGASKTGAAHKNGCNGLGHKWTATNTLPSEDGYYYLSENITSGSDTYLGATGSYSADATGTMNVALDLNGKTVTKTGSRLYVFGVLKEATLSITDTVGTGKVAYNAYNFDQGVLFWNRATGKSTLNIFGGTFDASKVTTGDERQYGGTGAIEIGSNTYSLSKERCIINIAGGKIYGQQVPRATDINNGTVDGRGGAIFANGVDLYISGDAEIHGTTVSSYGGAIYAQGGTAINMNGGTVYGGTARKHGGAIYLAGSTLTMDGNARIMNGSVVNTSTTQALNGGNVYANATSTITMNGNAQITGGLNDAAKTNSHGGNVYLVAGSSLTLNDNAKITGGNAKNGQGGNIAVYGTLTVNDDAEISGGSSNGNAKSVHADIVCINGIMNFNGGKTGYVHLTQNGATGTYQFNVQGDPEITAVSMSFYSSAAVTNPPFPSITVTGPLEGANIGISTNIGADKAIIKKGGMTDVEWAVYLEYAKQFHYNATNRTIVYESDGIWVRSTQDAQGNPINYTCLPLGCKDGDHVEGCLPALIWEPLTSEILVNNRITRSGNYYLTEDITPSNQICIGNTNTANSELVVLLDLNGYNINGSWRALQIWNDAELTLLNTSSHPEGASPRHADGGGVITTKARADETWSILQMVAGGSNGVPNTSPTVNMHSGVTLMNPGTIIAANGGGVAVSGNGTFNMYGGTVIGGSVDETKGSGCAFYVTAGSTLNVFGGEIVGATASKGGAIYNLDGIVNLNNVTVSGGSAAMGGAIYNTGSLSLNNVTLSGSSAEQGTAIYSTQDIYLNGTVNLSGDIAMTGTKLEFGNRLKITNTIDVDMNLLEGPITYGADASPNVGKLTVRGEATILRNGKLCKRPTATSADQLLVGFGAASLNPTQQQLDYSANGYKESYNAETKELSGYYPLAIQGYGYNPAGKVIATQNGTTYAGLDLQATAIAYSDYDGDVIVMISVDSTSVNNSDTMRKEVAAYIGVPAENVMISATHAHSTPAARNVKTFYDASGNTYTLSETYYETFLKGVKAAAKAAVEDRSAVKNLYTATVANVNDLNSGVNGSQNMFNQVRNYVAYKKTFSFSSWSYVTEKLGMATPNHYEYENTSDAQWLEPESEVDDNLQLVKYVREEGTDIVIANFQCHPILFGTGGSGSAGIIHSDVVGSFRYQLSNTLGANVAYFSGAGGNVNSQPDTLMSTDGGTTKATKYAGSLAGCESWGKHLANIVNSKLGSFEQCTGYDKDVAVDKTVVHYNKMVDTELDDCNYSLALRREMAIRIMNKGVANLTDSSYSITTSCPDARMCTGTCTHAEGTCPAKVCTHGTSCPFNGKTYSGWQIRRDWKIYSYYHASTGLYNRRNNVDGQTAPMTLFAYAAGPIAFAAAPYEMFDTNGLEIKTGTLGNNDYTDLGLAQKENPFAMTIVATKTSVESSETSGYVPSRIGYANGGYSTDISPYAAGTGELLVTEFLTMLNGLKND